VVLFGSVARGQAETTSDVDVLLVVGDTQAAARANEAIARWQTRFARRFAKPVSVLIKTREELTSAKSSPLVRTIVREGELLSGEPLETVIGNGE